MHLSPKSAMWEATPTKTCANQDLVSRIRVHSSRHLQGIVAFDCVDARHRGSSPIVVLQLASSFTGVSTSDGGRGWNERIDQVKSAVVMRRRTCSRGKQLRTPKAAFLMHKSCKLQ
ncbi:hypothetical protein H310_13901 [Aphanomyces invadans]|uniref:Uncharacterized protein n=1 Tax=Aphanomyces invadans TaxID=157072 RepID=A0A024TBH7_9STRA|nr:hypothetical protein H310_13901 [Aphanomyces invadans]ETV91505.1 hypothetical protein H310_13901 [Aphanomyces invadans]|eukprot:XP_008879773.1 hypothetical protein H310_13901 [Aphanomyces invadans]